MASPVPDSYNCASGGVISAGRHTWGVIGSFAKTVAPGVFAQFPAPSLQMADSSGYWPFIPPSGIGTLDWACNLPVDSVGKKIMAAGGRTATDPANQKLIWYDAKLDKWDSILNPFGTAGGHIYQSLCIASERRRFFHTPLYANPLEGMWVHEWNLDTWSHERSIPAPPQLVLGNNAQWGEAQALVWQPNLGDQGSILFFGAADGTVGKMCRYDWATQQWIPMFGNDGNFVGGHCCGVYVPAAGKSICGKSNPVVTDPRAMTVINADGSYYQTSVAPINIGPTSAAGGLLTPHPSRRAAIIYDRQSFAVWTYEFDTDTYVYQCPMPAALYTVNSAASTLSEEGVVVITAGTNSATVGKTMHIHRPDF